MVVLYRSLTETFVRNEMDGNYMNMNELVYEAVYEDRQKMEGK